MNNVFQAILRTLVYADIFDYPLTAEEVWYYLITSKKINFDLVQKELRRPQKLISSKGKYFFLRTNNEIWRVRENKEKWSQRKLKIARRVANWWRLIPWVKMVAVIGSLAINNVARDDDIDILIVTAKNRLWLTRALTVLLVELVAKRRRPDDLLVRDKICLNMFLAEDYLAVPKNERDLFSAHEVCQLKVIWEKEDLYQKFIKTNQWINHFLANWNP